MADLLSRDAALQKKAYEEICSRPDCVTDLIGIAKDARLRPPPPLNRDLPGTNKRAVIYAAWALGELRSERAIGPLADLLLWFALPNHDGAEINWIGEFDQAFPAVRALQRIGKPAAEELLRRVADGRIQSSTELFHVCDVVRKGLGEEEGKAFLEGFLGKETDARRRQRLMNPVFVRWFGLKGPDDGGRVREAPTALSPHASAREHLPEWVPAVRSRSAASDSAATVGRLKKAEDDENVESTADSTWSYLALGFAGSTIIGLIGAWLLLRRRAA